MRVIATAGRWRPPTRFPDGIPRSQQSNEATAEFDKMTSKAGTLMPEGVMHQLAAG